VPVAAPAAATPYWQQRLEYDISATLDESRGTLGGGQRVVYHNNSPDTLHTVAFHLYLNAFRPGSRWSDADSLERRRRFNDLADPDFGYNRVSGVAIDGTPVEAEYPFAPDSTIVRFMLPKPAAPGGTFTVSLGWEARPSTVFRRQGRAGRQYDLAQWYPRVVAYDRHGWNEHPLYPAGEFYGDFGDFRVTLDVPEDQVVGATGVPVCGDPGWERVNSDPSRQVEYRRDAYGTPQCDDAGNPGPGRKRIVWEARDVHHFAMAMNPGFVYEGGRFGTVLVHVLYRPDEASTWGNGIAVRRTVTALEWLDGLFGPFPWPQITNVRRLDRGGTEFPMMVQNSSAGQGLILHEVGHNYLMGILANNEWREGFLDEGFTSFQTAWFNEAHDSADSYTADEQKVLLLDLDRWSQPTSLVSERYRDFSTYNAMVYDRAELFYYQLRTIVGDRTMREILRTYYERWKLKHVDEAAFRAVAEEVSKQDLSTFFGQWLHGAELYDYAIGRVRARRREDAGARGWTTRVEVVRKAPGIFPVDVVVRTPSDSGKVRVSGMSEREWVELSTAGRPREVEIDPGARAHDWNQLDNRKKRGLLGFGPAGRTEAYFDRLFWTRTRRDRLTLGLVPALWYNDEGGVTIGGRMRSDYLGRFEQNTLTFSVGTSRLDQTSGTRERGLGGFLRIRNPLWLYMPRTSQTLEAYWVEGRAGASAAVERQTSQHRTFGPQTYRGASVRWLVTTDTRYLDPALWDGGGTVEAEGWVRSRDQRGTWTLSGRLGLGGGVEYRNRENSLAGDSYDAQPYLRLTAEGTARRALGGRVSLALRGYAGWVESGRHPLKQRQLFIAGADPYGQFANPFLRSRGALLAGRAVHYQMPGGGGLRGIAPGTSATRLLAINVDADRAVVSRPDRDTTTQRGMRLFREVRVGVFGGAALGNGEIPKTGSSAALVADAGIGIKMGHRIGQTSFVTRFDVPFVVTRPRLAVGQIDGAVQFRWVVSASPAF